VNLVVLASAIVPPIIAIIVCRVLWIWSKSQDRSESVGFSGLLRRALWLPERPK
jgi:hypothetical protein